MFYTYIRRTKKPLFCFWHDVHELSVTRNCKHFRRRPFVDSSCNFVNLNFRLSGSCTARALQRIQKSMKVQRCRQKPPPSSRIGSHTSDQRDQNFNHEPIVNEYKSLPSILVSLYQRMSMTNLLGISNPSFSVEVFLMYVIFCGGLFNVCNFLWRSF